MWTSQQKDALWKKWCEDDHLDDIVRCERIASEAVSLFLARASGQAKEDLAELRATIDHSWGQSDAQNAADRASLDRLSALAQEAESLRAKVAEVEKLVEGGHRLYRDLERAHAENRAEVERLKDERAELQGQVTRRETEIGELEDRLTSARSEVERLTREHRNCAHDLHTAQEWGRARQAEVEILKAENAELQCQNRSNLERANQFEYEAIGRTRLYKAVTRERDAAESRLAAVRERGKSIKPDDEAPSAVRWVLEGDAPGHPERVKALSAGVMSTSDGVLSSKAERVKAQSVAVTRAALGLDAKCYAPGHINCPCGWDPPQTCHYPTPDGEPTEAAWKEARELQKAYDRGAEAMRAACLEAIQDVLARWAVPPRCYNEAKSAIEGAAP
jgi:hypothetical protein